MLSVDGEGGVKGDTWMGDGMSRLNCKMRQKVLKTWQKSTQIVLEFLKKCLKF